VAPLLTRRTCVTVRQMSRSDIGIVLRLREAAG
jgi:hypothetical protein